MLRARTLCLARGVCVPGSINLAVGSSFFASFLISDLPFLTMKLRARMFSAVWVKLLGFATSFTMLHVVSLGLDFFLALATATLDFRVVFIFFFTFLMMSSIPDRPPLSLVCIRISSGFSSSASSSTLTFLFFAAAFCTCSFPSGPSITVVAGTALKHTPAATPSLRQSKPIMSSVEALCLRFLMTFSMSYWGTATSLFACLLALEAINFKFSPSRAASRA
mmetsp:Transcript_22943/g.45752  ORF Transcript_22943/g.45752 Transcript_22943/m.45752 type:complete len:221 (-) Transcript_22943:236-898(-)